MSKEKEKNKQNHNEVEFSQELADSADKDAVRRMKAANERAKRKS